MAKLFTKEERGLLAVGVCLGWGFGVLCLFLYDWKLAICFVFIWGGEIFYKVWDKALRAASDDNNMG